MAGNSSKTIAPKARKRVEVESGNSSTLVRGRDGSAFARCQECNKDVPVALISMHSCSLDAKIKMNLETQVAEAPAEAKKKPAERKKAPSTEPKAKRLRKEDSGKKIKDANKPKRPPTAFFIFMEDFRKTYKEANPGAKAGKEVASKGGEEWRSLTDEAKKQYVDKAAELKAAYDQALQSNNAENEDEEGGSDKEVIEVPDESSKKEDGETGGNEKEEEENLDDY